MSKAIAFLAERSVILSDHKYDNAKTKRKHCPVCRKLHLYNTRFCSVTCCKAWYSHRRDNDARGITKIPNRNMVALISTTRSTNATSY